MKKPRDVLENIAALENCDILSEEFAQVLDSKDPLAESRDKFAYPPKPKKSIEVNGNHVNGTTEDECIYLCGNSLGLKPKRTDELIIQQLNKWANRGVELHFEEPLPAALCDRYGKESLGRLIGSDPESVTLMNGLTVNLHLLLMSFYQPTPDRYKILIEGHAFPSDRYAMKSQAAIRGYDPKDTVIEINPREGEDTLRIEDILEIIEKEGHTIAVVCLSGVQYYTGQKFDMEIITKTAQNYGCLVGWDLAHAIGNVKMELDHWNVDFACWCTYKYLNSGAGCIAGSYVNKKHNKRSSHTPHLLGWWSNKEETRFQMSEECDVAEGVDSFRLCNPSPLLVSCVLASLEIFDEYGMDKIVAKQFLLTGYLELLLNTYICGSNDNSLAKIITPSDPSQRGCQISIEFNINLQEVHNKLNDIGVVCDIRLPRAMRIAPAPLYNTFADVYKFIEYLRDIIKINDIQ